VTRSGDEIRHQIRLLGPAGIATVRAARDGPASFSEDGEPILINGAEGRLVEGSTNVISWILDDVFVTAEAPAEVDLDDLRAIAESVEVAE
jgi:hypothetical protein